MLTVQPGRPGSPALEPSAFMSSNLRPLIAAGRQLPKSLPPKILFAAP